MMNLNRSSRMHPGWACFFIAFGSGFFTLMSIILVFNWMLRGTEPVSMVVTIVMAIGLFILGGRQAEKLRDIHVVAVEASSQEPR